MKGKNPAANRNKGKPNPRNSIFGTIRNALNPRARETPEQRAERLRNTGVTPRKSRAERRTFESQRTPTSINSRPGYTPVQVRAYIDAASSKLSPATVAALRRAEWFEDDSQLLTLRPTNTTWPAPQAKNFGKPWYGPRTLAAGYDYQSQTLFVRFRGPKVGPSSFADGVGYEYYNVSPQEWAAFQSTASPGRYIDSVLNAKPYTPATW
jgi:hypothetical protein